MVLFVIDLSRTQGGGGEWPWLYGSYIYIYIAITAYNHNSDECDSIHLLGVLDITLCGSLLDTFSELLVFFHQ